MNVVFSDLLVRHEKRMEIDFSALHDLINGGKNEGKLKTFSLKKFCHFTSEAFVEHDSFKSSI